MYQFTEEDRRRGAQQRNLMLTPIERRERARKAAWRRWYKVNADDEVRINRDLQIISGIVGMAVSQEDWPLVLRALATMAPFERMKIALNRGLIDVTPQIEQSAEIEAKLSASRKRREQRMSGDDTPVEVKSEQRQQDGVATDAGGSAHHPDRSEDVDKGTR